MPAYHSSFNAAEGETLCGCPVLPLKTRVRGPAPCVEPVAGAPEDVVDEALRLFRANVLFRNFELQGGGDKLLVYLTLFIHLVRGGAGGVNHAVGWWQGSSRSREPTIASPRRHVSLPSRLHAVTLLPTHPTRPPPQCLKRAAAKPTKAEGVRDLQTLASSTHVNPGDAGWPLTAVIAAPKNAAEQEAMKGYCRQLRETVVARLCDILYADGAPNKHWLAFSKRKFMGREFSS